MGYLDEVSFGGHEEAFGYGVVEERDQGVVVAAVVEDDGWLGMYCTPGSRVLTPLCSQ